jgi:precorrin-8X/cobalt-precorrin-8 methylmutase
MKETAFEDLSPEEIEKRSFEIIEKELSHPLPLEYAQIIKRVIHATADFDYADSLIFSETALSAGLSALLAGEKIATDTNMIKAGINKSALSELNSEALCFMADLDVAEEAKRRGCTRAQVSMEKASNISGHPIIAVGNAPTALIRLCELIKENRIAPSLVIGTPVGFVNVVKSKEILMRSTVPYIVSLGRKGGSTVAAAILNALLLLAKNQ